MEAVTITDVYGTYYYIDSSSSRDVLTLPQMQANATYIWNYVVGSGKDWTINAVSAMCGNFRWEGVMNPSQWQYGQGKSEKSGYGLGQWTPATKLFNFLSTTSYTRTQIAGQIEMVQHEADNNLQWISTSSYPLSMLEFLSSTDAPATLASAWLYDWERPKRPQDTEAVRREWADYWYELLSGTTPPEPPPSPPPKLGTGRLKPCYYHRFKYE